jgi:hypothetical protein
VASAAAAVMATATVTAASPAVTARSRPSTTLAATIAETDSGAGPHNGHGLERPPRAKAKDELLGWAEVSLEKDAEVASIVFREIDTIRS